MLEFCGVQYTIQKHFSNALQPPSQKFKTYSRPREKLRTPEDFSEDSRALQSPLQWLLYATPVPRRVSMEIGQAVELMGVENAGIDLTGKRGIVKAELPGGLVSVAIDGGDDVISVWPEHLKIVRATATPAAST